MDHVGPEIAVGLAARGAGALRETGGVVTGELQPADLQEERSESAEIGVHG